MDSKTKTGKVYLRPHKPGKKWKPVLLSLFPQSSSGVGRLEIQDLGGGCAGGDHGVRRLHPTHADRKLKVVRLSELIRVLRLPPNAEACPTENTSAFCVETPDRSMVFAAPKDDCVDWVEKLCHVTFQGGPSGSAPPHMEENQIYASAGDALEFWVVVQRTEAATRCGLKGSYWLQVGREALLLRETQKKSVVSQWPYELLRRYGKDKLSLTIEAGRRCDSGPGSFTFETQQAEKIFSMIQSTIRQKTSTAGKQSQDGERATVTDVQAHSPLPKIPTVSSPAAILENKPTTQERKAAASEESQHHHHQHHHHQEDLSGSVQPAPVTLMPLPLVPTHEGPPGGHLGGQSEAVYADPFDCMQSVQKPHRTEALYVDPASYLPLKPPGSKQSAAPSPQDPHPRLDPDSVYSEVYDKISAAQTEQRVARSAAAEPIYAEPISKTEGASGKKESTPDPFAHLYAQVCKTAPPSGSSSSSDGLPSRPSSSVPAGAGATEPTDPSLDDVIYENLGII